MPTEAPYDEIADWYENEFLARQRAVGDEADFADRLGIDQALAEVLGPGGGTCVEIGSGDRERQNCRCGSLERLEVSLGLSASDS